MHNVVFIESDTNYGLTIKKKLIITIKQSHSSLTIITSIQIGFLYSIISPELEVTRDANNYFNTLG